MDDEKYITLGGKWSLSYIVGRLSGITKRHLNGEITKEEAADLEKKEMEKIIEEMNRELKINIRKEDLNL